MKMRRISTINIQEPISLHYIQCSKQSAQTEPWSIRHYSVSSYNALLERSPPVKQKLLQLSQNEVTLNIHFNVS